MLRNTTLLALSFITAAALIISGCEKKTTIGIQAVEDCTLDVENLDGMFVAMKASPEKGDFEDKDFRIFFYEKGGKKLAKSTGGRVYPALPLTEKFQYEFKEFKDLPSGDKEAYYWANLAPGFEEKEIEEHKKKNKNLGWKLEGMLYIRVDEKQCKLKISDMYATYMEGERVEDFNMGGQSSYVKSEEQNYSMISCPPAIHRDKPQENRQGELIAWSMEAPNPNKDQSYPRGPKGTLVPTNEPVHWMFIDAYMNDKQGVEEGCNYYLDVYFDDLPVEGKSNIPVTPGKKWTYWKFDMTHSTIAKPTFIEIHRHKVCGGKDEIIDAVCNIVQTEPAEGAAESG